MTGQRRIMQPLNRIHVLDLSRVLAGPYCTMVLGDLGADVIKVESPEGDETRGWGPPFVEEESAYFLCVNRNKRSIVVDFKTDDGLKTINELVKRSDVLVENFRPGTLARFSLDVDTISNINPKLIYCSITGFGQTGPLRDRPGYDFMIQAMGGLMSFTGKTHQSAHGLDHEVIARSIAQRSCLTEASDGTIDQLWVDIRYRVDI